MKLSVDDLEGSLVNKSGVFGFRQSSTYSIRHSLSTRYGDIRVVHAKSNFLHAIPVSSKMIGGPDPSPGLFTEVVTRSGVNTIIVTYKM